MIMMIVMYSDNSYNELSSKTVEKMTIIENIKNERKYSMRNNESVMVRKIAHALASSEIIRILNNV